MTDLIDTTEMYLRTIYELEEEAIVPLRARIAELERHLDQAWDLLRQRRAKRQYDENPDEAQLRPEPQVESYLQ